MTMMLGLVWGVTDAARACLAPGEAPALAAHDVPPPGALRFWAVITPPDKLWTTQNHAAAHNKVNNHPGAHVWQITLPTDPAYAVVVVVVVVVVVAVTTAVDSRRW